MAPLVAVLLAMAPGAALANAGVGFFMVAVPVVAIALVPAILLEAPVLRLMLKVTLGRALLLSLWANLASALIGFVAGIAFDLSFGVATGSAGFPPTRASAAVSLVLWFFLSWWIEHWALAKRMAETPRPLIRRATGGANLLTYALMLVGALASPLYPLHDTSMARPRVSEAVLTASGLRTHVAEFWDAHKRFPADTRELGYTPPATKYYVVALQKDGRIMVRIDGTGLEPIDGRRIELIPRPDDSSRALRWTCTSADIEIRYLPSLCHPGQTF